MSLTKKELIAATIERTGQPRATVEKTVNAMLATIRDELARGEHVGITGFGTFEVRKHHGFEVTHPKTGEAVDVQTRHRVLFRPAQALKESVN